MSQLMVKLQKEAPKSLVTEEHSVIKSVEAVESQMEGEFSLIPEDEAKQNKVEKHNT